MREAYREVSQLCGNGGLETDEAAIGQLRSNIFVPQREVLGAEACMFLPEESSGLADLVGKVDLRNSYPDLQGFFSCLGVPHTLTADQCRAALQALPQLTAEHGAGVQRWAEAIYRCLEEEGPHRGGVATDAIFVPGGGFVDRWNCIYLEEQWEGLADLLGKVDLRPHYPGLQGCFTRHLDIRRCLTAEECIKAIRELRGRSEAGLEEEASVQRLSLAAYKLLERETPLAAHTVDLSIVFEEEALVFLPGAIAEGREAWRSTGSCMWHDVPADVQVSRVSLETVYPPELQRFFVETAGVRALAAKEVLARLDKLKFQGDELSQSRELALFAEAYTQVLSAKEAREQEGLQFWDADLFDGLKARVFVPELGLVPHHRCVWQSSHRRYNWSSVVARHNLLEVYEGLQTKKVTLLRRLKQYFADWLGVSDSLTVDECLDGLRALHSGKTDQNVALVAKGLYCELARTLKTGRADDTTAAAKAFKHDSIIHVPDGEAGKWCTADQCVWRSPEEAPEGWQLTRSELSPHYADEVSLKSLFTEHLGVPMSVRFGNSKEKDSSQSPQQTPSGQPFWLLSSDDGKKLVPQKRSATPPPHPQSAARSSADEVEGDSPAEEVSKAPARPTTDHIDRSYVTVPDAAGETSNERQEDREKDKEDESDGEGVQSAEIPDEARQSKQKGEGMKASSFEPVDQERSKQEPADDTVHTTVGGAFPGVGHGGDVPPPPDPHTQCRGVAGNCRAERRSLLAKLARSVSSSTSLQMSSQASRIKHRPEESMDCNPHHDLQRVGVLELVGHRADAPVTVPVWVERRQRDEALANIRVAKNKGDLEKFATLLVALSGLFSVPTRDRVHIFEEDAQTVAFNSGALFFNLRYFTQEAHFDSWEEAVSFWTISFSHELAHAETPIHDRQFGRIMESAQRAILPGLPAVLGRPWSCSDLGGRWKLQMEPGCTL